jgi:two-component system, OmpR family, sensor histidine kinase KdpD
VLVAANAGEAGHWRPACAYIPRMNPSSAAGSNIGPERERDGAVPRWRRVVLWVVVAALLTMLLSALRGVLDKSHMALAFVLLVLAGSAIEGRAVGLILSVLCFLIFNFFLLPPFYTFRIAQPLDWGVLFAFLVTAGVAAELLHRQQAAAARAEQRVREMDRLAALGAESLSVGRAVDAVAAIERVIRTELPVEDARIELLAEAAASPPPLAHRESGRDISTWAARECRIVALTKEHTTHMEEPSATLAGVLTAARIYTDLLVPLAVRGRTLGVLRLTDPQGLRFDAAQANFAHALAYYAALAAERVRLTTEADRVEALREADRLKDALLASVSHDLRTPLTSIRATAHELSEAGEERGTLIEEEAERLNRLVADLLDLSRLRADAFPLKIETNAAEDLVGAALQRIRAIPGAAEIVVRLPGDETVPVGRFDFVQSLRALTNLLENALRHSPAPGSVELEVRVSDGWLEFDVLDRGPGVNEADREHLFEPFFRSATPGAAGGTGLGLAIADRIARAQGGAIVYRPRAGAGSVFLLRLPATTLETG